MSSLFDQDPCAGKHGGNPQSADAYESGKYRHATLRELVVEALYNVGPAGMTRDSLAKHLGKQVHSISARVTELLAEERPRIQETGRREATSSGGTGAVLVHVSHLGGSLLGGHGATKPSAIRERM